MPDEATPRKWRVLRVLPFSSDRKRMSVIVQSLVDKKIYLLTKGADSMIEELLEDRSTYTNSPTEK
jgi:magnesium-transporting ATPase (P-type)